MNTVIERTGFDPAQDADNGNRFLTGNGYMGCLLYTSPSPRDA